MTTLQIGKGASIDVDLTVLPGTVRDWAVYNWVRLTLERSHASVTEDTEPDADKRKALAESAAAKRWESMVAGNIRAAVTRETDPLKAEIKRIAGVMASKAFADKGIKAKDIPAAAWTGLVAVYSAKESVVTEATENVARAKARVADAEMPDEIAAMLGLVAVETPTETPAEPAPEAKKTGKRK